MTAWPRPDAATYWRHGGLRTAFYERELSSGDVDLVLTRIERDNPEHDAYVIPARGCTVFGVMRRGSVIMTVSAPAVGDVGQTTRTEVGA